jgi:predicted nucleotidyltransferase
LDTEASYYCKLFFFSEEKLIDFLQKYAKNGLPHKDEIPYFVIENDDYITSFLNSLSVLNTSRLIIRNSCILKVVSLSLGDINGLQK